MGLRRHLAFLAAVMSLVKAPITSEASGSNPVQEISSLLALTVEGVLEPLTPDEESERHQLELKVERAFYEAGKALAELRDRRLYRDTHPGNFMGYCRDRFGKTKQAVNYLIAACGVYENLFQQTTTNCCRQRLPVLPTNEYQVRFLAGLEPEEQRQVWEEAVGINDGKLPSGRIVKSIVESLKQKRLLPLTASYKIGDVFKLFALSGTERRYNGCWAITSSVNEFTLTVEVHDATLIVKPENLNSIDSPNEYCQLPSILRRIKRLRECDLDRIAYTILESLGRQMYLTELEADILLFLEQKYGIEPCHHISTTDT